MLTLGYWIEVKDGDPRAVALYRRHYSAKNYNHGQLIDYVRLGFSGIGKSMILLTPDCRALFGWRKQLINDAGQDGVNCFVFCNEGTLLSSLLILEAEDLAWHRWQEDKRLFTFVDAEKTKQRRGKNNPPGKCFIDAGWQECGFTQSGLVILEKVKEKE